MKAVTGRRMAKLAESKGWILARINGSHHVYTMQGRMERVVIPIHGNKTLKIGLQRSLMKMMKTESGALIGFTFRFCLRRREVAPL